MTTRRGKERRGVSLARVPSETSTSAETEKGGTRRCRASRNEGRPEPASGATARRARAGARRVPLGRGSIGEDVRRRLDGTICGPLATIRAPYPRGWEVAPRATRGPRKNALARDENPLRTRRGNRRSSRVGIELHLASKAIGLGGPGGESHVLCVTLRTGATAENADIGRRLRGASGRLRGTHAWERRGERSVVVVHSEPEKHAVGSERSVERDAATRRVRSRRGLGKAPRATGRAD